MVYGLFITCLLNTILHSAITKLGMKGMLQTMLLQHSIGEDEW